MDDRLWIKMCFYLMVPLVLLITSVSTAMQTSSNCGCNESPFVPNIGYLFQGYDIFKGNPLQEDTLHFDPGLRQPIFKAICGGRCTSDRRYRIPDGTSVLDCSGCSLSFSTKQVSDVESYRDSLSLKVSAEGGGYGAAFSASYGHKNVESKTQNSNHIFTHSEASCCSYKAQMLNYMLPPFSDNFITAIENLPQGFVTDADREKYQEIIDTFGTHYIHQITMGSLFGEESEISSEDLKTMQDSGTNINAAASYSGFDVTASAKFSDQSKTDAARTFQQKSSHQRVYTMGPPPPENNNMNKWALEADKSPEPISQKLKPIINLLEKQQSLTISTAVMENLKTIFNNYCTYLEKLGLVSSCNPQYPEDDCVEYDTIYPGYDINLSTRSNTDKRNSAVECRRLCVSRSGCNFWTWKQHNKECLLKSSANQAGRGYERGTISGPIVCEAVGKH